jgi:beta-glucosidase
VIYARGSDVAANMPAFEAIPASALFASADSNRRSGLNAEYFNTANFDGKAHRPAELTYPNSGKLVGAIPPNPTPLFTRVDPNIDFHWGDGAPRRPGSNDAMNDDDFGVRWTGYLSAPVTGIYQLGAIGMNAWALSLDGKQIARTNSIYGYNYEYAPVELQAGKLHKIALDYHEFVNDAGIQLVWSPPRSASLIDEAIAAVEQADTVVMVLGLSPRLEGEEMKVPVEGFSGGDRLSLDLPAVQEELLEKVTAVGKPIVLVLMNGSAVAINWAHDHVPAIVEGWYPGQAGGTAIADVLFGDYNPAGRLPVTFYKSVDQLPAFTDYSMKNRTYRYFHRTTALPFGYGLSYTSFAYRNPVVTQGREVKVSVEVENTGSRDGDEVVQLYITAPVRALAGFRRITLKAKERRTVDFTVLPAQLRGAGSYQISVGGGQPGYLATGIVSRSFHVPQP